MRTFFKNLLGAVFFIALCLGCASNPDGSCNLKWTLSCLAISAICGYGWGKLDKKDERKEIDGRTD